MSHRKSDAKALRRALAGELADQQERLYAAGRSDPRYARNVLLVLQGMDTAGKGGVIRHAIGMVDPQGVQITAFKAPTKTERAHPFLWRIERALPGPGIIGIFDRSHYEDVLTVRVHELVPEQECTDRYAEINAWEAALVESGTVLITYQAVLERCSTQLAPWFVVPADHKWYRNWRWPNCGPNTCGGCTWTGRGPTSTWGPNAPGWTPSEFRACAAQVLRALRAPPVP